MFLLWNTKEKSALAKDSLSPDDESCSPEIPVLPFPLFPSVWQAPQEKLP